MKCPNCGKEMKSKVRDYAYVESGLKNVVLMGITVHECKHCGEVLPEIRNIKQIHQSIAEYQLKKQGSLTGPEFRFLRKAMGKSAKETAECLAVNPVTISRWENNKEKIGPQSDRLLRMTFVLDPAEARSFAATKLLKFARTTLGCTITTRKERNLRKSSSLRAMFDKEVECNAFPATTPISKRCQLEDHTLIAAACFMRRL